MYYYYYPGFGFVVIIAIIICIIRARRRSALYAAAAKPQVVVMAVDQSVPMQPYPDPNNPYYQPSPAGPGYAVPGVMQHQQYQQYQQQSPLPQQQQYQYPPPQQPLHSPYPQAQQVYSPMPQEQHQHQHQTAEPSSAGGMFSPPPVYSPAAQSPEDAKKAMEQMRLAQGFGGAGGAYDKGPGTAASHHPTQASGDSSSSGQYAVGTQSQQRPPQAPQTF